MPDNIIEMTKRTPNEKELPQGSDAFLSSHKAVHDAIFEMHAPYLNKHPGIHSNYLEISKLLKLVGFHVNDSINMIMNPDLFPMPEQEEKQDAPQSDA